MMRHRNCGTVATCFVVDFSPEASSKLICQMGKMAREMPKGPNHVWKKKNVKNLSSNIFIVKNHCFTLIKIVWLVNNFCSYITKKGNKIVEKKLENFCLSMHKITDFRFPLTTKHTHTHDPRNRFPFGFSSFFSAIFFSTFFFFAFNIFPFEGKTIWQDSCGEGVVLLSLSRLNYIL